MHPKLWILCFADFCRVIVASSNLGAYDNKVNNQYWVHDFQRRRLEAAARHVLYDSEPRGDAEGADEALAAAVGDAAARRLVAFADGGLAEHREAGLSRRAPARPPLWDEILRSYDLTPPEGVHFIGSVPGFRRGAFADAFGHRAIRRAPPGA
ncbi:tyrosyl-DNA phosphodiesterase [Aureococcus anophagefferens]|nr:tyrosyl-DNA phosphodiesterase [Aureococcus anophagefferens]